MQILTKDLKRFNIPFWSIKLRGRPPGEQKMTDDALNVRRLWNFGDLRGSKGKGKRRKKGHKIWNLNILWRADERYAYGQCAGSREHRSLENSAPLKTSWKYTAVLRKNPLGFFRRCQSSSDKIIIFEEIHWKQNRLKNLKKNFQNSQ